MTASATSTFPVTIDAPQAPTQFDNLATPNVEHDLLHDWAQDAIKKIEAKLGITSSPDVTSIDYVLGHHQHQGTDRSAQFASIPIKMVASQVPNPLEVRTSLGVLQSAITPAGEFLDVGATAATLAFRSNVIGDTQDRWLVQADGTMKWGPGGATAPDVTLARISASALKITGSLQLSTPLAVAQGGTGSTTQNFVDLSTAQTINGAKTFSTSVNVQGSVSASAVDHYLGVNAFGGTGSRLHVGAGTDGNVYLITEGTGVDIPLVHTTKGNGGHSFVIGTTTMMALSNSALVVQAGSVQVAGTGPYNAYGDLAFTSTAAATGGAGVAVSDFNTGSPRMYFDHRGTSNTGDFFWRNGTGGSRTLMTLDQLGQIKAVGDDHHIGSNAFGGTGGAIRLYAPVGDPANAYVITESSGTNASLHLRPKGTGATYMEDGANAVVLQINPRSGTTDTFTGLSLYWNILGGAHFGSVSVGPTDSGGAGYRLLRVPNT